MSIIDDLERWPGYTEQSWQQRFVELDRRFGLATKQAGDIIFGLIDKPPPLPSMRSAAPTSNETGDALKVAYIDGLLAASAMVRVMAEDRVGTLLIDVDEGTEADTPTLAYVADAIERRAKRVVAFRLSAPTASVPVGTGAVSASVSFGPCQHQWAHQPTTGSWSCIRCNEFRSYDSPPGDTQRPPIASTSAV